jgi:DNA-binding CsgD family transcriptional regulator
MFPSNFLTDLARKYELSPEQKEVFLLGWGNGKDDREISEQLRVTTEAIRNRKTGIYRKFSIAGVGANKAIKLRNWLEAEAKKQNIKADIQPDADELELLVQDARQKIAEDVAYQCGTMRVLDTTQVLDQIYTDVNIIKDVTGRRRIDYDKLIDICTREDVNRFSSGDIEKRISGLDAVEEFKRLMVWGKPGAGKTTFMKYLAMSCLGGKFHSELVLIFVELRFYAAIKSKPTLQEYIWGEFQKRDVAADVVKRLLKEGRALILLDGLDEVKKEDDRRVKQDIDQFSRDWLKNRFAITCRIAAREYQFEKFTEVEVADFDDGQIETFVNNWFRERDESKAERLLERLKDNEPVKELATNPLLLTLLCLVFGERNDFPPKRSELYKEGLEVLMKKWDAKRNIEREIIYQHLSPQNKEDMLGQIAFNTFVNGEYFFRQEDLQRQIKDYICNLPEASADPDHLRLDSEVVLKAIEHHHGLLVERARNIYSFSHLTFQEYFAAKAIERGQQLEILVQNISNPRWKEVFYLTAEMLWRSDGFLKLMKFHIDRILEEDEKLQEFLEWAKIKAESVKTKCKNTSLRAFYGCIASHIYIYDHLHSYIPDKKLRELNLDYDLVLTLYYAFNIPIDPFDDENYFSTIDLKLFHSLEQDCKISMHSYRESSINLNPVLVCASYDKDIQLLLKKIKDKLPDHDDLYRFYEWWEINGEEWKQEFRQLCIDRRNIGHDWQFTCEQVELLNQYYKANLLLVECMNRSYVSSKQVREEIESTMLLPSKK